MPMGAVHVAHCLIPASQSALCAASLTFTSLLCSRVH